MKKGVQSGINLYNGKSIGIIGGVEPYSGIDLMSKILFQTHIHTGSSAHYPTFLCQQDS